jgi:hypothetical protein
MPEDKMDSSIPQVTLKASTSDQPAGQGLSSVKKRGKENATPAGLAALIGGPQSFASLLMKKGHGEKEGALNPQVESAAGNNDAGKASMKNAKTSSGISATGEVSEVKTKGMWNSEMSGKTQIVKADEIRGEDDTANLPKGAYLQEGETIRSGSVSERGEKVFLKQGVGGFGSAEKMTSVDARLLDGETGSGSAASSTDALKGNSLTKKNAVDGVRVFPGDEMEDQKYRHDTDPSKGSDVKGLSYSKISGPKGREMQSMKDGNQCSAEVVKDNMTSIHQIQTESEKIENYKNLSTTGLKSERSLPSGADDIQTGKTGSSLSAAQTDFSIGNGIWNDVRAGVNDKIAAPVIFQEVAGQIIDGASNMLMKGSSRIVITLEPPNLGTLNMDVRVQHDMVRMVLIADNHEVKKVLHANLDQLKTALQGQGLNIDRFDVLVNERSYDGNQGFQPGGGALFEGGRGRRDDTRDHGLQPQMLPSGGNEINEPSLGIISLFV